MVKREVVRRRLERLAEYLTILERFQDYELEIFLSDPEHYGSAERFLQLAIEATMDVGSHIVAEENLGPIDQSRDVPRRLREHGDTCESRSLPLQRRPPRLSRSAPAWRPGDPRAGCGGHVLGVKAGLREEGAYTVAVQALHAQVAPGQLPGEDVDELRVG